MPGRGFTLPIGFLDWLGSRNRTAIPPLNIDIILWWKLGHTVLIFQSGYHLLVQSQIPGPDKIVNPIMHRSKEVILTIPTLTYPCIIISSAIIQYLLYRRPLSCSYHKIVFEILKGDISLTGFIYFQIKHLVFSMIDNTPVIIKYS